MNASPKHYPGYDFPKIICLGTVKLDRVKREVYLLTRVLPLESKEYGILELLATHINQALPWDYFHNVLWNHPDPNGQCEIVRRVTHLCQLLKWSESSVPCRVSFVSTPRGLGVRLEMVPVKNK